MAKDEDIEDIENYPSPSEYHNIKSNEDEISNDEYKMKLEERKWTNRRRLAFISMAGIIVLTVISIICDYLGIDLKSSKDIITTSIWSFAAIDLAYMGAATYHDAKNKKFETRMR